MGRRTDFTMTLSKMKFPFKNVTLAALYTASSLFVVFCQHHISKSFSQKSRARVSEKQPLSLAEAFICQTAPLLFHPVFPPSLSFASFVSAAYRNQASALLNGYQQSGEYGMIRVMGLWLWVPDCSFGLVCIC